MPDPHTSDPEWLVIARELQAIAQTGQTYADCHYDRERYDRIALLADRMLATGFDIEPGSLGLRWPRQSGYATPQIDVRAALFEEDKVLLVRETTDGLWSLPGGWADVHLSPAQNAAKEFEEEAGLQVRVTRPTGLYDRRRHPYHPPEPRHCYKLYFLCERLGGDLRTSDETDAVDFFPIDRLPPLSETRVLEAHIRHAHERHLDPSLPLVFDQ